MNSLINTKWIFNENPVIDTIIGYDINFTDGSATYNRLTIEDGGDGHNELKYYDTNDMIFSTYQNPTGWVDPTFKTIIITGGRDAKNEELFAFLTSNATQEFIQKNIVLEKDNIELFPRTKASLLVQDDGKTPWAGGGALPKEAVGHEYINKTIPLPIEDGYVDTIYFNTELSVDEVLDILNSTGYDFLGSDMLLLALHNFEDTILSVIAESPEIEGDEPLYVIMTQFPAMILWSNKKGNPEYGGPDFAGWNPDFNGKLAFKKYNNIKAATSEDDYFGVITEDMSAKLSSLINLGKLDKAILHPINEQGKLDLNTVLYPATKLANILNEDNTQFRPEYEIYPHLKFNGNKPPFTVASEDLSKLKNEKCHNMSLELYTDTAYGTFSQVYHFVRSFNKSVITHDLVFYSLDTYKGVNTLMFAKITEDGVLTLDEIELPTSLYRSTMTADANENKIVLATPRVTDDPNRITPFGNPIDVKTINNETILEAGNIDTTVLTSPNGTKYRIKVGDNGELTTEKVI